MEKWKKTLLSVVLCAVTLLCLASCSAKSTSGKGGGSGAISGKLTYWGLEEPNFKKANMEIIKGFKEKYPKVKVAFQAISYDAYLEKLKVSYSANQQSDIQEVFGSWANAYMKNNLFLGLPTEIADDARNRYFPATLGGYTYNNKLYGIPREFNIEYGGLLYYPADLKKAGYESLPATYDGLVEAAQKMTITDAKGTITHYGLDFLNYDSLTYIFLAFILQQGGDYWKDDNVHVNFSTSEAEKAFTAMTDLVTKYKVTEIKHFSGNEDTYMHFFKGTSSMAVRGPWVIAAGQSEYKRNDFSYGAFPSFSGNSKVFAAESGWGNVVAAKSKNLNTALEFLKFATSPENNLYWNSTTSTIPSEQKIAEDSSFAGKNPLLKVSLDILKEGKPIGPLQDIDKFKIEIIADQFMKVCSGKTDVKTALKNIEDMTNSMIDEIMAQ